MKFEMTMKKVDELVNNAVELGATVVHITEGTLLNGEYLITDYPNSKRCFHIVEEYRTPWSSQYVVDRRYKLTKEWNHIAHDDDCDCELVWDQYYEVEQVRNSIDSTWDVEKIKAAINSIAHVQNYTKFCNDTGRPCDYDAEELHRTLGMFENRIKEIEQREKERYQIKEGHLLDAFNKASTEDLIAVRIEVNKYLEEHNLRYIVMSDYDVYPASNHPDDGYLWMVVAEYVGFSEYKQNTKAVWTCWNTETKCLNYGHYDIPEKDGDSIRKILVKYFHDVK